MPTNTYFFAVFLLFSHLTHAYTAEPVEVCGGKYRQAASLVDAALSQYGTLYSGGNNTHTVGSLTATVDLYALWRNKLAWTLKNSNKPNPKWEDGCVGECVYHENQAGASESISSQNRVGVSNAIRQGNRMNAI